MGTDTRPMAGLRFLVSVLTALALGGSALRAQERVIYSASGTGDVAPFVTASDPSGNLYGADWFGGTGYGSIFELSPSSSGSWTETTLYTFTGPPDGWEPMGVVRDSAGNLYGTTLYGGAYQNNDCVMLPAANRRLNSPPSGARPEGGSSFHCGSVFELSPNGDGSWSETTLYNFTGGRDGATPQGGLVFDREGNLYGTTSNGGAGQVGVAFELSPVNGGWTETVLHNFGGSSDGAFPNGNLAIDAAGNLYGTTPSGNTGTTYQNGIVFELSSSGGTWVETVLHKFGSTKSDGLVPYAGVIVDAAGNVYGTTSAGGAGGGYCGGFGCGTVYELTRIKNGGWREVILYAFAGTPDASSPDFPVTFGAKGSLYGAAGGGSATSCQLFGPCGTVYKLASSGGRWHEKVLHSFAGSPDGNQTDSGVIFGPGGHVFGGTTYGGSALCTRGSNGCGVVYEVKP